MPKAERDPLAAALDAVTEKRTGGTQRRVLELFGDRPQVLDAIRKARRDRGLSFKQIAELVSTPGASVTAGPIQKWLNGQGIQ
jgi:ribosome-binding protein aMBF1 (putative translation factor)